MGDNRITQHGRCLEIRDSFDIGPGCKGKCRDGWTTNSTDQCGDGNCCNSGQKVYCCPAIVTPSDCYWAGTATICDGGCSLVGYEVVMTDNCGDGKCCDFGRKVLCCRIGS